MGMSIEKLVAENDKLKRQLAYESSALTMMKADYEARLKADMVATLSEIQLEFDEKYSYNRNVEHDDSWNIGLEQARDIIQEKINALKGEENE